MVDVLLFGLSAKSMGGERVHVLWGGELESL